MWVVAPVLHSTALACWRHCFSPVPAVTDEKPDAYMNWFLCSKPACFPLEASSWFFVFWNFKLHSVCCPLEGPFQYDDSYLSSVENSSSTNCFDFIILSTLFGISLISVGPPFVTCMSLFFLCPFPSFSLSFSFQRPLQLFCWILFNQSLLCPSSCFLVFFHHILFCFYW